MTWVRARTGAWGLAIGAYVLLSITIGLAIINRSALKDPQLLGALGQTVIPAVAIAAIGGLIASRLPRNAIGWVLLSAALVTAIQGLLTQYETHTLLVAPGSLPAVQWVAWSASIVGGLTYPGLMVAIMLLFPDGRLPGRAWRVILWLDLALTTLNALIGILDPTPIQPGTGIPPVHNPTGVSLFNGLEMGPLGWVFFFGQNLVVLAAVATLVVRLRRARGEARQQLRWVVYALVVATGLNVLLTLSTLFIPPSPTGRVIGNVISNVVVVAGFGVGLPLAIGVAILKYRLYDIDVVISRTLVYSSLAAFITAVYVGIVVGIGSLIGSSGQNNVALSLLATAIVAVAFEPVRAGVQRFANRLIYGERATPYEVMAGFADRMAGTLSADDVLLRMAEAAARGVGAEGANVSLEVPDGSPRVIAWPPKPQTASPTIRVPVTYRGERIGEIAVLKTAGDRLTSAEERLLGDLATQAGLVLHNLRLTTELQARLVELSAQAEAIRASRQRLVLAADVERQRLQSTLHRSAAQDLVGVANRLGIVVAELDRDPAAAAAALDQLTVDTQRTLDGVRALAHGIYPPLLRDQGLAAALRSQVSREVRSLQVDADGLQRYAPEVEAAVYFCCLEALTGAEGIPTVRLAELNGQLEFSIAGVESPNGRRQDIEDRIQAVGGTVSVRGSAIVGHIPVGVGAMGVIR